MSFVLSHGPGLRKQAVTQSGALIPGAIFGVTISSDRHTICRMTVSYTHLTLPTILLV